MEGDPVVIVEKELDRLTVAELDYMTRLLIVEEEISSLWADFENIRECTTYIISGEG